MVDETPQPALDLRAVFGLQARVTASAAATAGAYVEMDCTADPGAATIIHFHPKQEETYHVLEGTLDVFRNGRWQAAKEGELVTIAPGVVHGFRNSTTSPVRFRNVHRPALGFQDHLETLDRLVRAGKLRSTRDPRSLMYMSMSAMKHRPDVPVKPPLWVVRAMAFVGRRLGYRLEG